MGIKDLTKFLRENAPESIKIENLSNYKDKKCAIDISIFLYKYKYKNRNLIQKLLEQINRLKINNITPIYIFDGAPPKQKYNTLAQRKEKHIENKNKKVMINEELIKLNETKNPINIPRIKYLESELIKIDNKTIKVTKEDIINVKYFFDILNINYFQAPGEADILCSKLCRNNIAQMVLSEDMDILTSGAPILMREFNCNNNKIHSFNLDIILNKLELTQEKFVEFCILCGCDYLKRLYGLGPKFSYKLIKENTIEEVLEIIKKRNKIVIPDNYLEDFNKAKTLFIDYNLDINKYNLDKELYDNQLDNIKQYLLKNTSLSLKQIDNRINNIYNK